MEWLQPLGHLGLGLAKAEPLPPGEWWALAGVCVALVAFAGLASGLTLGLMSLDAVDMEVLKRSGTEQEKAYAARIIPVIANEHFLLVTLLLCNAAATEALPLFLDRLADPLTAVLVSVSVVLVFGEVLPQAVCSRYGLQIGASSAWFVRALMFVCAPIAWPIGKLLDALLGGEHTALFRRAQLKALVSLHGEVEGLGGTLSGDEIAIISGALDLTNKTAWTAMTPLDKVFMLPAERVVDEGCLQDILSRGHSRVPVFRAGPDGSRSITGLLLVKELVLVEPAGDGLTVGQLPTRPLPRLSAATPLYDMLQLFEAGGSHIALLTRPSAFSAAHRAARAAGSGAGAAASGNAHRAPRSGLVVAGDAAYMIEAACDGDAHPSKAPPGGWGDIVVGEPVGIISIEDVIEELLGTEIIDETDLYVDNQQTSRVDAGELSKQLPARLRKVLARGEFTPRVGRLGAQFPGRSAGNDPTSGVAGGAARRAAALNGQPGVRAHLGSPRGLQAATAGSHPQGAAAAGPGALGADAVKSDPGSAAAAASPPAAIGSLGPAAKDLGGTPSSWAAGAHSGARRVRFGTDSAHGGFSVLKPRLRDPDEGSP